MAEPQQTRRHSPPGRKKVRISYICHEGIDANLTIASRGISNKSVGAKFTRNRNFFRRFSVSSARPERFLYGRYWDPTPERGVPWGYPMHNWAPYWLFTMVYACVPHFNLWRGHKHPCSFQLRIALNLKSTSHYMGIDLVPYVKSRTGAQHSCKI